MKTVLNLWKKVGMWFVLIVLLLIFTIISPAFRTANHFGNILKQISILGVAAVGISFVLISGSVDLSIGAIIALEIVVMAKMLQAKIPLGFVIVAGLLIAAVCSTINGLLANTLKIPAFTITLATMNIYQGVAWLISGGKVLGGFLTSKISIFATKYLFKFFPLMGVILIVSAIIGIYLLSKTYFGRYVYAIGGNAEAARLAGINTKKTTIEIHIIAGIFYGIVQNHERHRLCLRQLCLPVHHGGLPWRRKHQRRRGQSQRRHPGRTGHRHLLQRHGRAGRK